MAYNGIYFMAYNVSRFPLDCMMEFTFTYTEQCKLCIDFTMYSMWQFLQQPPT